MASERDAEHAAARRAFIRSAHPDLGGDPAAFVEGLARFDAARPAPSPRSTSSVPRPSVRRSRRPDRLLFKTVRDLRRRLAGLPPRHLQ